MFSESQPSGSCELGGPGTPKARPMRVQAERRYGAPVAWGNMGRVNCPLARLPPEKAAFRGSWPWPALGEGPPWKQARQGRVGGVELFVGHLIGQSVNWTAPSILKALYRSAVGTKAWVSPSTTLEMALSMTSTRRQCDIYIVMGSRHGKQRHPCKIRKGGWEGGGGGGSAPRQPRGSANEVRGRTCQ